MTVSSLLVLSLGASVVVAAIAALVAEAVEQRFDHAELRERLWSLALYAPLLPPLAMVAVLVVPTPVSMEVVPPVLTDLLPVAPTDVAQGERTPSTSHLHMASWAELLIGVALVLALARFSGLGLRTLQLLKLVRQTSRAKPELIQSVTAIAKRHGVVVPEVRTLRNGADAFLTGILRPLLVLPEGLAETPTSSVAHAVISHELAHLQRGDHYRVWIDEAVCTLFAFNPLLPFIRDRLGAAREELCDAQALAGAEASDRQIYAHSLLQALRASANTAPAFPALTFTGSPRIKAMRRLKHILNPPARVGRLTGAFTLMPTSLVAAMTVIGSVALADQRSVTIGSSAPPASATVPSVARIAEKPAIADQPREMPVAEQNPTVSSAADAPAQDTAAVSASRAALSSLPPELQARYRAPTAAQFRQFCGSSEPVDNAFCAGVLFSQLPYRPTSTPEICPPLQTDGAFDVAKVAADGRQTVSSIPIHPDETITGVARAALMAAFPCETSAQG